MSQIWFPCLHCYDISATFWQVGAEQNLRSSRTYCREQGHKEGRCGEMSLHFIVNWLTLQCFRGTRVTFRGNRVTLPLKLEKDEGINCKRSSIGEASGECTTVNIDSRTRKIFHGVHQLIDRITNELNSWADDEQLFSKRYVTQDKGKAPLNFSPFQNA